MNRILCGAALAAALAAPAWALAKPNPLPAELRQTLFVKNVELVWSFDDAKTADDAAYVAYKQDAQARVKDAVAAKFANSPAGSEPVTLKIDVRKFDCGAIGCSVSANVAVVELSDGKELGVYQKVQGFQVANGGLLGALVQAAVKPDVVGIMSANFAAVLRAKFDAKK